MCANQQLLAEAQHLLRSTVWRIPQGGSQRGVLVRVLLYPQATEQADRFDVVLKVQAVAGRMEPLDGLPVVLRLVGDTFLLHYGRLNQRGQVLFRGVRVGDYQMQPVLPGQARSITPPHPPDERIPPAFTHVLTPLPPLQRMVVALAAHEEWHWEQRYQHASGVLSTTLRETTTGDLACDVEAPLPEWDGTIVPLHWQPGEANTPDFAAPYLLIVPLAWSESLACCAGHLVLGTMPDELRLHMPDAPCSPAVLTAELAPIVQHSIAHVASAHTLRAWQRLRQQQADLPAAIQAILATLPED
jgi:hypothetical protein